MLIAQPRSKKMALRHL